MSYKPNNNQQTFAFIFFLLGIIFILLFLNYDFVAGLLFGPLCIFTSIATLMGWIPEP
tara:strand:+ start:1035 stop:1208 length:174 start_codon:yes stop_codon:yes gene_type:complete